MKSINRTNYGLSIVSLRLIVSLLLAAIMVLSTGISAMACEELSDYEMLGGYDAYEGPEAYDSYEEYLYYCNGDDPDIGYAEIRDDMDYAENALTSNEGIEVIPLSVKVGATDATFNAKVINHTGKSIDGVGATLYYTYGGVIKSSLIGVSKLEEEFYIAMTVSEHLDEKLEEGLIYDYKIFVECDDVMYTYDKAVRFETNDIDDKIALEVENVFADRDSVTIDTTVYNPTGAKVEAIGCRLGDGTLLKDEDVRKGEYTDTALSASFNLTDTNGQLKPGKKYNYEIYIICEGTEYEFGIASFTAPE